ncbi:neuraminidase-like domain-containing protein [Rathayibacter oskolensis]|uniref:Tc toxin subunit A-related protein n=1 Tax=Rathayibacter oskolensis TaxID=1891671 RepID=UPI000A1CB11A|nr:neuraminidase-like domain-containing protein [Rathayibacter oskolensis]
MPAGQDPREWSVHALTWDDGAPPEILSGTHPDQDGAFAIEVDDQRLLSLLSLVLADQDGRVRAWSNDPRRMRRALLVADADAQGELRPPVDLVERPAPETSGQRVVRGIVTDTAGRPLRGVVVRAVDRDLRSETPLGPLAPDFREETRTAADGRYEISYAPSSVSRAERGGADLQIRALGAQGEVVAASPILFDAGEEEVVDLVVVSGELLGSDWERLVAAVLPLLESADEESLRTILPEERTFLLGETRLPERLVDTLLGGVALADAIAADVPIVGCYALAHALPGAASRAASVVAARGVPRLTADIESAVDDAAVPERIRADASAIAERVVTAARDAAARDRDRSSPVAEPDVLFAETAVAEALAVDDALDAALRSAVLASVPQASPRLAAALAARVPRARADRAAGTTLTEVVVAALRGLRDDSTVAGEALAAAGTTRADDRTVAELLSLEKRVQDNPLLSRVVQPAIARSLAETAGWSGDEVLVAEAVAESLLTRPALAERRMRDSGIDEGSVTRLRAVREVSTALGHHLPLVRAVADAHATDNRALAGWSPERWADAIGDGALPGGSTREAYVRSIVTALDRAHPTAALQARLSGTPDETPAVSAVLAANPQLELATAVLRDGAPVAFDWGAVPEVERAGTLRRMRGIQRVIALGDSAETRATLLRTGFTSARAITALSEEAFVVRSELRLGVARTVYAKATRLRLAAGTAFGAGIDLLGGSMPTALAATAATATARTELLQVQGYAELFGDQSFHRCPECRTVLGAPAYLVRLLRFLDRCVTDAVFTGARASSPLSLRVRRPDIRRLRLDCANTNDRVRYLDIACDVLEADAAEHLPGGAGTIADVYAAIGGAGGAAASSFELPADHPSRRLVAALARFGLTPPEVYRMLGRGTDVSDSGVPDIDAALITTPDPGSAAARLGVVALDPVPLTTILDRARLSRTEWSGTTADPLLAALTITVDPITGAETLHGLTADLADRLHRLVRLGRALGWGLPETISLVESTNGGDLDTVLAAVGPFLRAARADALTPAVVLGLAASIDPAGLAAAQDAADEVGAAGLGAEAVLFAADGVESASVRFSSTLDVAETALESVLTAVRSATDPSAAARPALDDALQRGFGLSSTALRACLAWGDADARAAAIATATVMLPADDAGRDALRLEVRDLLRAVERIAFLVDTAGLDDAALVFATAHPVLLGLPGRVLDRRAVLALGHLGRLGARPPATGVHGITEPGAGDPAAVVIRRLLLSAGAAGGAGLPDSAAEDVAALFGWEPSAAAAVLPAPAADPLTALVAVDRLAELATRLGTSPAEASIIGDPAQVPAAAELAVGAVDAAAESGTLTPEDAERMHDRLAEIRRDVLAAFLIDASGRGFGSLDDLFSYYLLDLRTQGIVTTSPVSCAIGSLQHYGERVRTGYERSADGTDAVSPTRIPEEEWARIGRFRIDSAAVSAFLHPDAFMLPGLRVGKTPLFEQLEAEILQGEVTEERMTDALLRYLRGLSELAHLRIVGAHKDPDGVYWLVGRTTDDPPVHHLRSWDGTTWSPWRRLDLPIDAPAVSLATSAGRLHVFWTDATITKNSTISGGSQHEAFSTVDVALVFASRTADGGWTAPQRVRGLLPLDGSASRAIPPSVDREASKGLKALWRAYPRASAGRILIDTVDPLFDLTPWADPPVVRQRLDLWRRVLLPAVDFAMTGEAQAIRLSGRNGKARLVVDPMRRSSALLDLRPASTEDDPVTGTWAHPVGRPVTDLVEVVHGGDLETVITVGDQQYLLHSLGRAATRIDPWIVVDHAVHERVDLVAAALAEAATHVDPATASTSALQQATVAALPPSVLPMFGDVRVWQQSAVVGGPVLTASLNVSSTRPLGPGLGLVVAEKPSLVRPAVDAAAVRHPPVSFGVRDVRASEMVRLTATTADRLGEALAARGLDGLFDLATQLAAKEPPPGVDGVPVAFTDAAVLAPPQTPDRLDLEGSLGDYYREVFRDAPWLISDTLRAAGLYTEALRWARRVVDPFAAPADPERPWRFIGLRGLTADSLLASLTDPRAVAVYRSDPFNPFAIAAVRPVAVQKALYRHLITLCLDAGDAAFSSVSSEEDVREALRWYTLASQIAGERPREGAPCPPPPDPFDYEHLEAQIDDDEDVVVVLENVLAESPAPGAAAALADGASAVAATDALAERLGTLTGSPTPPSVAAGLLEQTLAFHLPVDETLLALWDRIDDRLHKIRNGLDITGQRSDVPLFGPPIDPMALVRARAAGLSTAQAAAAVSGAEVPVHRFAALLPRVKEAIAAVGALESELLQALERKDGEELALLRSTHERTLQGLATSVRERQLEEAQLHEAAALSAEATARASVDALTERITAGLLAEEDLEVDKRAEGRSLRATAEVFRVSAVIAYLIPQVGSPLAMTFGGQQLGGSLSAAAGVNDTNANAKEGEALSAALTASRFRRLEEWRQQLARSQGDLDQLTSTAAAAGRRVVAAERELAAHRRGIELAQELDEFLRGKLTGLGLYTYQAQALSTLHRQAYTAAMARAKKLQQAYAFENDDSTVFVTPDGWDAARLGVGAAARLRLQVTMMEDAALDRDARRREITQTFPLSLFGDALERLRRTGSCTITIPELLFDIVHPGHYHRVLRGIRLATPGLAGPHTSIAATLSYQSGAVRLDPPIAYPGAPATARPVPSAITASISTSGRGGGAGGPGEDGRLESGVPEERYRPFEGLGAVDSTVTIRFPQAVRSFDYDSISEALLTYEYTAKADALAAEAVEAGIRAELSKVVAAGGFTKTFSLRGDFPEALAQLTRTDGPAGEVTADLTVAQRHFPYFLAEEDLPVSRIELSLVAPSGAPPALRVDGVLAAWTTDPETGDVRASVPLPAARSAVGTHTLAGPRGALASVSDVRIVLHA